MYKDESLAQAGGDYVCWSFQAIKHLTTGDGGALSVPKDQRERARLLRWFGLDRTKGEGFRCGDQDIREAGFKYHMNDIAATIGLSNLPDMGWLIQEHINNAVFFHGQLGEHGGIIYKGHANTEETISSSWLHTILVDDRQSFMTFMAQQGITTSPVHSRNDTHTAFRSNTKRALPGVEKFAKHAVAIPCGWWVTPEDQDYILETVCKWQQR